MSIDEKTKTFKMRYLELLILGHFYLGETVYLVSKCIWLKKVTKSIGTVVNYPQQDADWTDG